VVLLTHGHLCGWFKKLNRLHVVGMTVGERDQICQPLLDMAEEVVVSGVYKDLLGGVHYI
jgi:hypothetical protein